MKIAIQGHPTRGKEVIQILESLGGKNVDKLEGTYATFYYIDDKNEICDDHKENFPPIYNLYTLEGFEREFPFKIGDKVTTTGTKHPKIITGITDTQWGLRYVISEIKFPDSKEMPHISQISLYKEMKEERNITLTLDKAREWYKKGGELKEIALQAFTKKELTEVGLPKTWEEFCKKYPIERGEFYITSLSEIHESTCSRNRCSDADKNVCSSQKSAEAHLAMIQLEKLRDCWRQGWEPDWNDNQQTKYCVVCYHEEFKINILYETRRFLSFPTIEMAKEFLECFKDLIEKAGDLI